MSIYRQPPEVRFVFNEIPTPNIVITFGITSIGGNEYGVYKSLNIRLTAVTSNAGLGEFNIGNTIDDSLNNLMYGLQVYINANNLYDYIHGFGKYSSTDWYVFMATDLLQTELFLESGITADFVANVSSTPASYISSEHVLVDNEPTIIEDSSIVDVTEGGGHEQL